MRPAPSPASGRSSRSTRRTSSDTRSSRSADPPAWLRAGLQQAAEWTALGFNGMRSALFFAESVPLSWLQQPGGRAKRTAAPSRQALEITLARLRSLLEQDARAIGRGVIPISVLAPRDPLGHGARFVRILGDVRSVVARRDRRLAREFGARAERLLEELPAYYRRNFHYQTDGYLSERSAELYEHQVELLFRGGADAMRRLIVPPLRAHFGEQHDGRGLRLLELGSGTGSATHAVARAFPQAKLCCVDLSLPYARHARRQLAAYERVECLQGDAAALDFAAGRFDAVYSVFLFHELPLPVREQVLAESRRMLKPGGFFGLVDSLQKSDDPELDWALDFFPRAFHEPYYAHYASHPMERLIEEAGFESLTRGTGYLAKWIAARAGINPPNSPD